MPLSQRDLEAFERDGWCGPFDLCDAATAARLLTRIREEVLPHRCEIYAHSKADLVVAEYRRDRHLDSPLMYRIAAANEIVSLLPPLIGPNILLWRSDAFEIGVGDPATSPHQDGAFEATRGTHPLIEAGPGQTVIGTQKVPIQVEIPLSVGAWIAMTPVTTKTGSLWVVPGTHKAHIEPVPGDGFAGMKFVPGKKFVASDGVPIEINAGQFILFHNLLVHGSYSVETGRRFAWTVRYVAPETKIHPRSTINAQSQDLAKYGAVLVAGQDRYRHNVMRSPPPTSASAIVDERAIAP